MTTRRSLTLIWIGLACRLLAGEEPSLFRAPQDEARKSESGERPNILLYVVDTLRADELGCYGARITRTPGFDRLAAEGALFTRCNSTAPATKPSMASLMTGLDAHVLAGWNKSYSIADLPEEMPRLSELLRSAGYHCIGITANPNCAPYYGFDRGFHAYHAAYAAKLDDDSTKTRKLTAIAPVIVDQVRDAIESAPSDKPFFLFVLSIDPHDPYTPPRPYDSMYDSQAVGERDGSLRAIRQMQREHSSGRKPPPGVLDRLRALYRGEITFADEHFGRLIAWLRETGRLDTTLVVLTADHGEEFYEHGVHGHSRNVYETTTHIPLILRLPGVFEPGVRRDEPVDMLDLARTVVHVGGGCVPEAWRGRDLRGKLAPRPIFSSLQQAKHSFLAARLDGRKMIHEQPLGRVEAYDLKGDFAEQTPLTGEGLAQVQKALGDVLKAEQRRVQEIRDARKAERKDKPDAVPPDVLEALRALGYVD